MNYGFFHPTIGYWQTISAPDTKTLDGYPDGTVEVPLRPSPEHDWKNGDWVHFPPPQLSPEELRAQMPDKTPREFRDILVDMGIFPQQVTDKINEIPFDIERQKALNAWEVATMISRVDPYVDMIGAMFDISPEDIDEAWVMMVKLN